MWSQKNALTEAYDGFPEAATDSSEAQLVKLLSHIWWDLTQGAAVGKNAPTQNGRVQSVGEPLRHERGGNARR